MENILTLDEPDLLMAESQEEVASLKTAAGLPEHHFKAVCLPVLRAFAENVQNLPLSATHFKEPRGAWNFGLTASMVAYTVARTVLFFPSIGAEERRILEPQCRFLAFLATLSTGIAMVANNAKIECKDDEYHPLLSGQSLRTWLLQRPDSNFSWRPTTSPITPQAAAAIAAGFIPRGLLKDFDLRAVLMLYEAIAPKMGMNGLESTLAKVVRESVAKVLEHYAEKDAERFKAANVSDAPMIDGATLARRMVATASSSIPADSLDEKVTSEVIGPNSHRAPAAPAASPETASELLKGASPLLVEWFAALKKHERYETLKDHLKSDDEGITVPITVLGLCGISSPMIRKHLEDAKLIVRRSDDAKSLILNRGLHSLFFNP